MQDIPRLILEKNLYGLDIDERAAQLAGFALLMKARADDRRLLDNPPKLNVLALQESKGLDADELIQALSAFVGWADAGSPTLPSGSLGFANSVQPSHTVEAHHIHQLIDTFAHALTFGSLIQIPPVLNAQLPAMDAALQLAIQSGDLFAQAAALNLLPLVWQARILGMRFDVVVVANPPYMGSKGMNAALKDYAKRTFPDSKSDLFAMFIERGFEWCKPSGFNSMVTMQSWMFLSSFQAMREKLLTHRTINTMAHLGARAFSKISGEVVQTTAFVLQGQHFSGYKPVFFRLVDGQEEQKQMALSSGQNRFNTTMQDELKKIPGSPVAYWVSDKVREIFETADKFEDAAEPRKGITTSDNDVYLRLWYEVNISKMDEGDKIETSLLNPENKWFPVNKGGEYRKWYGNKNFVINWENNGYELKKFERAVIRNPSYYFREGMTWNDISSGLFSMRYSEKGSIFERKGPMAFVEDPNKLDNFMGIFNSTLSKAILSFLCPTLNFNISDVAKVPILKSTINDNTIRENSARCIFLSKQDWNAYETSWDFTENPLIRQQQNTPAATISSVIPAGMPESSHRDVKLSAGTSAQSSICANATLPSMALDSGIPAGMTAFSDKAANPT